MKRRTRIGIAYSLSVCPGTVYARESADTVLRRRGVVSVVEVFGREQCGFWTFEEADRGVRLLVRIGNTIMCVPLIVRARAGCSADRY